MNADATTRNLRYGRVLGLLEAGTIPGYWSRSAASRIADGVYYGASPRMLRRMLELEPRASGFLEQTGRECTIDDHGLGASRARGLRALCGVPGDDPPALGLPQRLGEHEVEVQHGPRGELPFGFKECAVELLEVERGEVREPEPSERGERVHADQRLVALVGLRAYPPPHMREPLDEVFIDRGGADLLARAHNRTLALQAPFQQLQWGARTFAA